MGVVCLAEGVRDVCGWSLYVQAQRPSVVAHEEGAPVGQTLKDHLEHLAVAIQHSSALVAAAAWVACTVSVGRSVAHARAVPCCAVLCCVVLASLSDRALSVQ
jgi:hypothetical protein